MNIQETIEAIEQVKRNREQAGHIWLAGIHQIINNAPLRCDAVHKYTTKTLSENPPFTKYYSSVQMLTLMKSIADNSQDPIPIHTVDFTTVFKSPDSDVEATRKQSREKNFFYVHLPINEKYHFEFPLLKKGESCSFIYTTCDRCETLETHGFPEISVRQSVYFEKDTPNMYDNRISVNHQSPNLIKQSYETLEDFLTECKNY